jgi:Flp pilus assembly pilin Flp
MKRLARILLAEDGVTVVEYTVMLAMIVLLLLTSVALLGDRANGVWSGIQTSLTTNGALNPR